MLERNHEHVLQHAIRGMIPKNRHREKVLLPRLFIYPGPFHPHHKQGLPQFTVPEPEDINEKYTFGTVREKRHEFKIIYESNPNNLPEEFADVERDIDPNIDLPFQLLEKTHTRGKKAIIQNKFAMTQFKAFAKYKKHKP